MEVARPEQADHPVAQVLSLEEQEHHHDEHDAHRGQRLEDRAEHLPGEFQGEISGSWMRTNCAWGVSPRRTRRGGGAGGVGLLRGGLDLMAELRDDAVGLAQPPLLQPCELLLHGGLVLRQVAREARDLGSDDGPDPADDPEGQEDGHDDRGHPPELRPSQQVDHRPQDEAEKHGQHEGNEHLAPEVQGLDQYDADREGQQAPQAGHEWRGYLGRWLHGLCHVSRHTRDSLPPGKDRHAPP